MGCWGVGWRGGEVCHGSLELLLFTSHISGKHDHLPAQGVSGGGQVQWEGCGRRRSESPRLAGGGGGARRPVIPGQALGNLNPTR